MRHPMLVMPALLAAVLLGGCYAPGAADPDRLSNADYPQIVTLGNLHNQFYYNSVIETPQRDNRPMRVSVNLRLKEMSWEDDIPCQYRFLFLDEFGAPIDPDPAWRYQNFPPRVNVTLQGSAPDTGAIDWRCEIRRDRVERLR